MPLSNRQRRRAALALLVALGAAVGAIGWGRSPLPNPEWPDTVPRPALADALDVADLPISADQTDVVLAAVCTLRRDRLEPYGHPLPTSPFLDRLADHGVLFQANFAQAPWTRPSMGALVTGRWPRALKLDNPGTRGSFSMVLADAHQTLAETLKTQGFRTIGAVANPNVMARFGFAQGFDSYLEPKGTYAQAAQAWPARKLVDRVIDEARATPSDQRIYARLLFTDTHSPHKYPRRYRRLLASWPISPARLRRDSYDASVRQVDAQLARLFVALRQERPNLLFIVVADHGEGLRLPAHHGPGHGNHLYRSVIQTPLIWYHPALPEPGRRVGGLSMNIDVVPTVLDLLGLDPPAPVDGASEREAVLGLRQDAVHDAVFSETYFRHADKSTIFDGRYQLIRNRRRLARGQAGDRLFAAEDIDATDNLVHSRVEEAARLAQRLTAWETAQTHLAEAAGAAVEETLDTETQRMLEAMGYTDDENTDL